MDDIETIRKLLKDISSDNLWWDSIQLITLIVLGLIFLYLKSWTEKRAEEKFNKKLEDFKADLLHDQWLRVNKFEHFKEIRKVTSTAGKDMLTFLHTMVWYCWKAAHIPEEINEQFSQEYDIGMKDLFPKMLGSTSEVASLDRNVFEKIDEIRERLLEFDSKIAITARKVSRNKAEAIKELSSLYTELYDMEKNDKISLQIWDLLESIKTNYQIKKSPNTG